MTRDAIYLSHETYTPPRGGCSQTEAKRSGPLFGESYREIIVGNTKGMTGHTMGASIEDAVAARSLQDGRCRPSLISASETPSLAASNCGRVVRTIAAMPQDVCGLRHAGTFRAPCQGGHGTAPHRSYRTAWSCRRVTGDHDPATAGAADEEEGRWGRVALPLNNGERPGPALHAVIPFPVPRRDTPLRDTAASKAAMTDSLPIFADVTKVSPDAAIALISLSPVTRPKCSNRKWNLALTLALPRENGRQSPQ